MKCGGDEGEGKEEKGDACDQEEEAMKIHTGWELCNHRIRAMRV